MKVLVAQLCPTPCDSMDCIPPGSSVHGILQGRILEWVAILFSTKSSRARDQSWVSHTEALLSWQISSIQYNIINFGHYTLCQNLQIYLFNFEPTSPYFNHTLTNSSILAWRIPCTEEPGGLQSMGSHRVVHN